SISRYIVAESTLMISTGQRRAIARAAAVLPDAVGPISSTTGRRNSRVNIAGKSVSTAPHEELVDLGERDGNPGGTAMVALIGTFGYFHLPQQGVHFRQG